MVIIILVISISFSVNAESVLQTMIFNSGKTSTEETLQGLVCSNIDFSNNRQKLEHRKM